MPTHEMTKSDASRIQSSQARSGGDMSSKGFAARAQSAGDHWASSNYTSGGGSNQNISSAGRHANSGHHTSSTGSNTRSQGKSGA
uniref:Uncharacterized protein n=1 Tax=Talaromyces marneffei PM1 TaxID=1077442 RepID=A0A093UMD5_TALMA